MDSQRAVIKEVGGTVYQLESVDKGEARLLVFQIDADHGSRCFAKLPLCQVVVRVVFQPHVVHSFYLRQRAQQTGELQRIGALHPVARIERFQSDGLHVRHLRRHVGTEVEQLLAIKTTGEIGRILRTIVYHHTAKRRGTSAHILAARHHLDVHAQVFGREMGEGDNGGVCHQRHPMAMRHGGKRREVGHLQLRIGDDFQEDAAGIVVYGGLYLFYVGKVAKARLHAKTLQAGGQKGVSVAEEVARGDDVLALRSKSEYGVTDGGHSRVEGCRLGCPRKSRHTTLEIGNRGVLHPRIVGG